ncbi:MAG TPA: hypothetical protein VGC41_03980, partial [Kofleriaceae bacterium]
GFKFNERDTSAFNFTFPAALSVHKNDIVVVHFGSSATCKPANAVSETGTITDDPSTTGYATAWDEYTNTSGMVATTNVLYVSDSTGTIQDAVELSDATSTAAAATLTAAATIATAAQWDAAVDSATFVSLAVQDSNATSTTSTGTTIQRVNDADTNKKADWTTGAGVTSTWGTINVGQAALP